MRTLKTRDLDEANLRKHGKLDEINRHVEAQVFQRTGSNAEAVAALNELLDAPDEERQDIYTEIIADRAEDIAERGHDAEAHRYFEIATGKGVPLSKLLTDVYSSGSEKKRLKSAFEIFSLDVSARLVK